MPQIETDDGVVIHFETMGSNGRPPVLLSNSLASTLHMWDGQAEALADHVFVVRYDSRGHGRSGAPAGPYTMDRLGRDAVNLMDALEIHRTAWCGLSMGGMVGMWVASHHPDRVSRLALCNTAAHMPAPDLWNGRIETAREKGMEALVAPTIERWFTPPWRERPENGAALERIAAMIAGTPPEGYAGCCAAIRDMDQREAIGGIEAPTLVLTGRDDPSTPPAAAEAIAGRIPGARLTILEECAHISNVEQRAAFDAAVIPFLKGAA